MNAPADNSGGLFVIGATHQLAPIAVRERLALAGDIALAAFGDELARLPGLRETVVLNTCNRVEIYGVAAMPATVAAVQAAYCVRQQFSEEEFAHFRLCHEGCDAVRHLFEVASGLDSQMLGETEIFGQVKTAYERARLGGCTGVVLNRVFQKAFQAAKHVRTHTAIAEGRVSVASVAVDLAEQIFGDLDRRHVLLLGAGEIGEKTARALRGRGTAELTVASRRFERAQELAAALEGTACPWEDFESRLRECDIAVCATSAPHAVVSAVAVAAAMRRRPARPLCCIDLAVPRDVEPGVGAIDNVYLYNLDDLARVAEENRRARADEVAHAQSLLAAKADAVWRSVTERAGLGSLRLGGHSAQPAPSPAIFNP